MAATPVKKSAPRRAAAEPATVPTPATAPVLAPDDVWGNLVTSTRDSAVVAEQAARNDKATREQFYERELQRLQAARDADMASLDMQIMQQVRIQQSCDAALGTLHGNGNVVHLQAAE